MNSVLKNSIIYTIGNLLLKAFSFFLIPLYTAYLTTEEYGIINLSSSFYTLAASVITLSLQYSIIRFYADIKDDKEKVKKMLSSAICFVLLLGSLVVVIFCIFGKTLTSVFLSGLDFWPIGFLSISTAVVNGLYYLYQDILKGMQKAKQTTALTYVYFFSLLIANIIAVVVLKMGALGVIWATFIVNLLMTIMMFFDLNKKGLFALSVDGTLLKEMLLYCIPLLPHALAFNISSYATRAFIGEFSLAALGLYSLALQFGKVSDTVLNSVQSAFQPWLYSVLNSDKETKNKEINDTTYFLMWLYGLFYIGVAAFSQEMIVLMSDKAYHEAWRYVPIIVITIALKAPLYFYNNFICYYKEKSKYLFVATLTGCTVNVILTWLLIPIWGVYGSIVADIVSMIIRTVISVIIIKEKIKQVYSVTKITVLSIMPVPFILILFLPSVLLHFEKISLINVFYKCAIILGYCLVLILFNKRKIKEKKNEFFVKIRRNR